jgi:hypothetical protein
MSEVSFEHLAVSAPCRDLRHAWDSVGDTVLIESQGQIRHFARTLRCLRCETERVDEYKISTFALTRVRTRYRYPLNYQIKGGIPVDEVRFRMFKDAVMVPAEDVRTAKESA